MRFFPTIRISPRTKNLLARIIMGPKADTKYLSYNDFLIPLYAELTSGGETEENWGKRQDLFWKLNHKLEHRDSEAPLPEDFYNNVKAIIGPLAHSARSERTTLSAQACKLVGNLAKALGAEFHPFLDLILPSLIDLSGSAKSVNQKNGHDIMMLVIKHAYYHHRMLYHISETFKDKRNSARNYAPIWLTEILKLYPDMIEVPRENVLIHETIIIGLNDSQIKVRENTRATYWQFHQLRINTADSIMATLNPHAATALKNDPHNPNKPTTTSRKTTQSSLAQIRAENKLKLRATTPQPTEFLFREENLEGTTLNKPDGVAKHETRKEEEPKKTLLTAAPRRHKVVATPIPLPQKKKEEPKSLATFTPDIREDQKILTVLKRGGKEPIIPPWEKENGPYRPARPFESLEKAQRSVVTAIEAIKNGRLDLLGYRKLKKLIEYHPGNLITSLAQWQELYGLLVLKMTSIEEVTESRDARSNNLNHPFYNRANVISMLINLLEQYPQCDEPIPGMTLVALLTARCCHQKEHNKPIHNIYVATERVLDLPATLRNPLAVIDRVLDRLMTLEKLITEHDPVPRLSSLEPHFLPGNAAGKAAVLQRFPDRSFSSLQALQQPKFSERLPLVMEFGVTILAALIDILGQQGGLLDEAHQHSLTMLAEHCLTTYESLIKRKVMDFCVALFMAVPPAERFYSYFSNDGDRNLIQYYVANATQLRHQQPDPGFMGNTGPAATTSDDVSMRDVSPWTEFEREALAELGDMSHS